jgi:YD repeat-containing protein
MKRRLAVGVISYPSGENAMDGMSWKQRGLVLLSILAMTLIGLAINKAPAGEQTRFYGPDGRTIGTATTSGNTTTFYGADGRRTGSATTSGNTTTFYGADGRRTGSATATGKR